MAGAEGLRGGQPAGLGGCSPSRLPHLQPKGSEPAASGEGATGREKPSGASTPVWHAGSDLAPPKPLLANPFLAGTGLPPSQPAPSPLFNTLRINRANASVLDLPG